MNFNAHSFAVSAYMTLMFTSAFLTLKVPGPLSFAAAGAGFEAAFSRISTNLEITGMSLPEASPNEFQAMAAGELKKAADEVEKGDVVARLPAPLCKHFGLNDGAEPITAKTKSTGTTQPRDLRGIHVVTIENKRYIVLSVYKGDEGRWYLTDEDGIIAKAAVKTKTTPLAEIPLADAKIPFSSEKAYWVEQLGAPIMVGKAGS